MTLPARLEKAHELSTALYLRRQHVELQRQQLAAQAQQIDQELLRLDGEVRLLTELIDADKPSAKDAA